MQGILENNLFTEPASRVEQTPGTKISLFGKLFGCWHKQLSRPFTDKNISYRACLDCGARRKFNPENFKTSGPFYFPPSVKPDEIRRNTK